MKLTAAQSTTTVRSLDASMAVVVAVMNAGDVATSSSRIAVPDPCISAVPFVGRASRGPGLRRVNYLGPYSTHLILPGAGARDGVYGQGRGHLWDRIGSGAREVLSTIAYTRGDRAPTG